MGVFWGVRSKECFCFILTGTVLFKFYFDFGVCVCASAPLTGILYNAKKELCPQRLEHSLRYVLCPCDPQDSSRSFSYPPPRPTPPLEPTVASLFQLVQSWWARSAATSCRAASELPCIPQEA